MVTIQDLKTHKKLKRMFSKNFNVTEDTIQGCAEELVSLAKENNGVINESIILAYASDSSTNLYKLFNWEESEEYRIGQATSALSNITLLFDSSGKKYTLNKI